MSVSGALEPDLPRLVGRRLQTEAVKAGKGCSASPNRSRLKGWTWYSRLAVSKLGSLRAKQPSCDGAAVSGPLRNSAYSQAMPARPSSERGALVQGGDALDLVGEAELQVVLQVLADARQLVAHLDAVRLQQLARADAGDLQQLRRADGAGRRGHLAPAARAASAAASQELDAGAAAAVEAQPLGVGAGQDASGWAGAAPAAGSPWRWSSARRASG